MHTGNRQVDFLSALICRHVALSPATFHFLFWTSNSTVWPMIRVSIFLWCFHKNSRMSWRGDSSPGNLGERAFSILLSSQAVARTIEDSPRLKGIWPEELLLRASAGFPLRNCPCHWPKNEVRSTVVSWQGYAVHWIVCDCVHSSAAQGRVVVSNAIQQCCKSFWPECRINHIDRE